MNPGSQKYERWVMQGIRELEAYAQQLMPHKCQRPGCPFRR